MLRAFGVAIEQREDGMTVRGGSGSDALRGARVHSAGDHRLAMLGAVAGLVAGGETVIDGAEAVDVSYPAFWSELARLGASREAVGSSRV